MNLIIGGTGALGSALVRQLLSGGKPVRIMTRSPAAAAHLAAAGAELVTGDLRDSASLVHACRGAETVIAAAHAMLGRGPAASVHVDDRGHRALIDAASAAGVRHFVYVSVYGSGPAFHLVPFFRIKREIETHLAASRLHWTVLRATAFMETHAHMLIGEPILRGRRVALIGRGDRPRNFVAAADVARVAAQALDDPSLAGATVEVGGPENLTPLEVVRLYERIAGRRAKVMHMPLAVAQVMQRVLRPVHPGISQVLQAAVLADTTDQRFDSAPFTERFGWVPTRLEDWVTARVGRPASVS